MSDYRSDGSLIKTISSDEGKMFVGGLSWDTDEEKLRNYFEQFGSVRDCIIKRDPEKQKPRGFGFVLFSDSSSVDKVLAIDKHTLDGRNIDPKRAMAMKKKYKLFVGGLNPDTTEDAIRAYFRKYGEIDSVERPNDSNTGKARGFCFINFNQEGVINEIISESKFHQIDGRQCECKDASLKNQNKANQQNAQYPYMPAANMANPWGFPPGYDMYSGYGYNSGYGGYGGAYAGMGYYPGYGGTGYGTYGSGAYGGTYGGGENYNQQQQNSGGKAKSGGRGGQNNYKPY